MPAPVGDPVAVSADLEAQQGGAAQTAKDLFSGAVGGIAQVLVGMCSHVNLSGVEGEVSLPLMRLTLPYSSSVS